MLGKLYIKTLFLKLVLHRDLPMSLVPTDYELPVETNTLEDFATRRSRIPCNLNFDDLCPRYFEKDGLDFGGCPDRGLSVKFRDLLEDYPNLGVTIFVIPLCMISNSKPWRLAHRKDRYDISSPEQAEWLEYYKSLGGTYNVEYAVHGCYHWQFENPLFGRHTEFAFKREAESLKAIATSLAIFHRAGLKVCGFRQPGWDINSDLSLCPALKKSGFQYIAGSSSEAGFNAGRQRVSNDHPTLIDGILNFPQNVLLGWDVDRIRKEIDRIVEVKGIISIKGHFVNAGMPNCLSAENLGKLRLTLDYLSKTYGDKIEHATFRELAERT